ncbi:MAG: DUF4401 domain-containing protein, partial [bacterium]|nr:DUF4401 domain-containing protein [bacterium]
TTTWRPLLYSLLFSLPVLFLLVLVPKQELDTPWIISNVIVTIALLLMYWWMFTENPTWKASQNAIIVIITAIILLGILSTPGLLISIGLLVLGYRLQEKLTLTIGIAFFPVYIIVFYYNVNMPLYLKSWLLAGTGAVLLLLRYGLLRRPGIKEES